MASDSSKALQIEILPAIENDEDWEEWDGRSPFWIHCVAGSLAGVTEHVLVYPLDTVRTHIQVCAACIKNGGSPSMASLNEAPLLRSALQNSSRQTLPTGMFQTIRYLVSEPVAVADLSLQVPAAGWARLWRGVETMLVGCIPAHALYFSSYEIVKGLAPKQDGEVSALGSSLAGAAATFSHDSIMTPLDTIKQRKQLGHYNGGVGLALRQILHSEGWSGLYRSFPVTLATNLPYGMIMVTINEACKQAWTEPGTPVTWSTILMASSAGGCIAAALTTPLDRIKTALQTQQLTPICARTATACPRVVKVQHASWYEAAHTIAKNEGAAGFFRGTLPRVLSHTPAVAISWTTYEALKRHLLQHYS